MSNICTCGCQGTGNFREMELNGSSLESLKEYEQALENELSETRERVKEIESKK